MVLKQKVFSMYIYELITPSDPITFKAKDDKVAYATAILLGSGKAGCHRYENGEEIEVPTMIIFAAEPDKLMLQYLGKPLADFVEENDVHIKEALLSFAYGDVESRKTFDDAIAAITDPVKLKEFKDKHEDRNRTSMNEWVQTAWKYGERFKIKTSHE